MYKLINHATQPIKTKTMIEWMHSAETKSGDCFTNSCGVVLMLVMSPYNGDKPAFQIVNLSAPAESPWTAPSVQAPAGRPIIEGPPRSSNYIGEYRRVDITITITER